MLSSVHIEEDGQFVKVSVNVVFYCVKENCILADLRFNLNHLYARDVALEVTLTPVNNQQLEDQTRGDIAQTVPLCSATTLEGFDRNETDVSCATFDAGTGNHAEPDGWLPSEREQAGDFEQSINKQFSGLVTRNS